MSSDYGPETNIREYAEGFNVHMDIEGMKIRAWNEGGYNCTAVDLGDVIKWLKENKPELLK